MFAQNYKIWLWIKNIEGGGGSGGSASTSTTNISSQDFSIKSGKAPLAVGDMLVALPETDIRSPDLTLDTKHVDSLIKPSTDYYAWKMCLKQKASIVLGRSQETIRLYGKM